MSDGANFSQQQEANLELNQELNQEFEYCLDDILASANFEPDPCAANASASASAAAYAASGQAGDPLAACKPSIQEAADALRNEPPADRRKRRRALISAPVRVRGINVTDAVVDEISTTIDVSRAGILFLSTSPNYARGMEVAVIFPYSTAPAALHAEQPGRIVRAFATSDGRYAVAVALGEGVGEDIVDSCGRKLADSSPAPRMPLAPPAAPLGSNGSGFSLSREPNSKRPLVLVVDADEMIRATLKAYLGGEGYDVMAVSNCPGRARSDEYVHARAGDCGSGRRRPARLRPVRAREAEPAAEACAGGVDDELRLSQRLRECAFARRGGLHDEALQAGATRPRGAFARAAARGILHAENWRAASGRSQPPLRLRQRGRDWRSEASRKCEVRSESAEAHKIPVVPVMVRVDLLFSSTGIPACANVRTRRRGRYDKQDQRTRSLASSLFRRRARSNLWHRQECLCYQDRRSLYPPIN